MPIEIPPPTPRRVFPLLVLIGAIWMMVYEIRHFESVCKTAQDLALMPINPAPPRLVDEVCASEKQKLGARPEAEVTRELK